jgi:hypothetical protein
MLPPALRQRASDDPAEGTGPTGNEDDEDACDNVVGRVMTRAAGLERRRRITLLPRPPCSGLLAFRTLLLPLPMFFILNRVHESRASIGPSRCFVPGISRRLVAHCRSATCQPDRHYVSVLPKPSAFTRAAARLFLRADDKAPHPLCFCYDIAVRLPAFARMKRPSTSALAVIADTSKVCEEKCRRSRTGAQPTPRTSSPSSHTLTCIGDVF